MKKLLIIFLLSFCFSGCGSLEARVKSSHEMKMMDQQLATLKVESIRKLEEFKNRLEESRVAYNNKELTEAEYLLLKNNIFREIDEYEQYIFQRSNMLRQEAENAYYQRQNRNRFYF